MIEAVFSTVPKNLLRTRQFLHAVDTGKPSTEKLGYSKALDVVGADVQFGLPKDVLKDVLALNLPKREATKLLAQAYETQIAKLLGVLPYQHFLRQQGEVLQMVVRLLPDYTKVQTLRMKAIAKNEKAPFKGIVRELTKNDLQENGGYLRIILESWVKDPVTGKISEEEIRRYLTRMKDSVEPNSNFKYFVAEARLGQLVGVVGYNTSPSENLTPFCKTEKPFELINYYSDPYWQGTGAGKILMTRVEEEIKSHGAQEIILVSSPRFRKTWEVYERRFKFENRGTLPGEYNNQLEARVYGKII